MANKIIFFITVWVWDHYYSSYEPYIQLETESEEEAREVFNEIIPSVDCPQVDLNKRDGEKIELIDIKEAA